MKKVSDKITTLSSDEKMIGLYNAEIEDAKIMRTRLRGAEMEGIEKGKKEMAKRLLEQNIDINTIILASNLTKEQILNIM